MYIADNAAADEDVLDRALSSREAISICPIRTVKTCTHSSNVRNIPNADTSAHSQH